MEQFYIYSKLAQIGNANIKLHSIDIRALQTAKLQLVASAAIAAKNSNGE